MTTLIQITSPQIADVGKRHKGFNQHLAQKMTQELEELGRLGVIALQNTTPKDQGNLSMSTKWAISDRGTRKMTLKISQGTGSRPKELPMWLNFGTGIYGPRHSPIVPKKAKFLHWSNSSGEHFAKSVRGMRATHYIDKAWAIIEPMQRSAMTRVGQLLAQFLADGRT